MAVLVKLFHSKMAEKNEFVFENIPRILCVVAKREKSKREGEVSKRERKNDRALIYSLLFLINAALDGNIAKQTMLGETEYTEEAFGFLSNCINETNLMVEVPIEKISEKIFESIAGRSECESRFETILLRRIEENEKCLLEEVNLLLGMFTKEKEDKEEEEKASVEYKERFKKIQSKFLIIKNKQKH